MFGITIDGVHTFNDLNLIFVTRSIGEAQAQIKNVSVPTRNGSIDMSEVLTGRVCYSDRTISFRLRSFAKYEAQTGVRDRLENLFAGKKVQLIFDDDKAYYWYGRCAIKDAVVNGVCMDYTIECIADPLKYSTDIEPSTLATVPVVFDRDKINEYSNIKASGSTTVNVSLDNGIDSFIVVTSSDVTVSVGDASYNLTMGSHVIRHHLDEGENSIIITGTAVVDINVTGGSL